VRLKLEDHIDAEKEYPLKVAFPKGGSGFLFVWHTEYEQHQVLWVKSKEQLIRLWPSLLDKSSDGDAKELWQFNIVAPPPGLRAAAAKHALYEDFRYFVIEVGCQLTAAARENVGIPDGYDPCRKYSYRGLFEGSSEEDARSAEETDKDHAWCTNCFHGYIPRGFTPEQFYLKKRDEVRRFLKGQSEKRSRVVLSSGRTRKGEVIPAISTAPEWNPKKPLYAVMHDFGPHSKGASVEKVKSFEGYWSNVKFYFQGKQIQVPREIAAEKQRRKKAYGKSEEKRMQDFRAGRRQEAQDAREMLERLLGPST
jgi:hypothetical protein